MSEIMVRVVCEEHHGVMGVARQASGGFPMYSMRGEGPRWFPDTRDTGAWNLNEISAPELPARCRECQEIRPVRTDELRAAVEGRRSKVILL